MRRSDEVESRGFHQVFCLFIPSDFLAKITSPCNKGRLGRTVVSSDLCHLISHFVTASPQGEALASFHKPHSLHLGGGGFGASRRRRGLIQSSSDYCQIPQSRTSRDSSPSMGAHEVSASLSAFSLRRRWAADCAARMRWKAENFIKISFFLSPPISLRKSPPLATRGG